MDGSAAASAVLVQNLINISKDEISLIPGLERDADKLNRTLAKIQASLDDAQKKFITEEAVRVWLQQLEAEAFEADHVLGELSYQFLSDKMKKKKEAAWFPSFNQDVHGRQMALTIKDFNISFKSINERATYLSLERGLGDAPDVAAHETESFTLDPIFINGGEDDVSKIVGMLTNPTEQAVSILPIVGMGGLGKTTLVRKAFNHEKTKTYFGVRIWVHVSQNFDAVVLLKKIFKFLQGESIEDESERVIVEKLQYALGGKMYVLVLDDVWNQDRQKWRIFMNLWSRITSSKGNCILVTTRSTKVGSIVNTLGIYHLNCLSEEECWSIIKAKAFMGGDIPPEFEVIGRSISKRCQGLPLAANVVGELLRQRSQEEWHSIKHNLLSDAGGDENSISRILKSSYDHLSSLSLKKCFAYCSVFPKGTHIEREDLVELWMAEGFLQPSQTSDLENVGNKFVDILVQSCLLQVVDADESNNEEHYSMHYLMHDVAASVNNKNADVAQYMCWQSHGGATNLIQKEEAKWLRTLFYEGEISDIMLSDFQSLHALTLRDDDAKELPDSVGTLIHLRYLNITHTSIQNLPDSIGKLYRLQTFKARNRSLTKLPITFNFLRNLRHLYLLDVAELPPQLGMFTSLRTIPFFKVHDEEGHRIEELGSLKNLRGTLKIFNLERVQGIQDSKKANLALKPGIVSLVLWWDERRVDEIIDENVLNGLKPHPNLKKLKIYGFKGARFPSWASKMEGLDNMMEIRLERCAECGEIPTLGHLPRLKSLYLSGLRKVKSIGSSFYGVSKETRDVFPALERLELMDMPNLTEWVEVEIPRTGEADEPSEVKVFPRLKYLKIEDCQQLKSAPSHFPCLRVLKMTRLREMVCFPDLLFHNNHNLSVLEIKSCPKLRELPDVLQSLKELTILACENLKAIPSSKLLRRLSIGSETVINVPHEMMESCALELEVLQLWGRPVEMQMIIEFVHSMPRLEALTMDAVPKFIITSPMEVGSLSNLKTFIFCPDGLGSWDCASFNKAADGILRLGSTSLRTVELTGNADWESLPGQLQHHTAISELRLYNFGMEELPKWFGNLSFLSELRLSFCNKLKGQHFIDVIRRLTNLTKLHIFKCPMLEKRIEHHEDDDSEWHEISRILTIQPDSQYI